jgi:hypothetical protein
LATRLIEVGAAEVVAAEAADELASTVFEAAAAGGAVDAVVLGGVEGAGCGRRLPDVCAGGLWGV